MSNWIYFLTEASVALVTKEDVRLTITSDYTTLTPLTFPSPFSRFNPPTHLEARHIGIGKGKPGVTQG